ncbi:MAG: acyltransferase [Bacteroidaceae bacterium]|nr:acyltransferase [Bacteroidaceae bacterium]
MKTVIKKIALKIPLIYRARNFFKEFPRRDLFHKQLKIKNMGGGVFSKYIKGKGNYMEIGSSCFLDDCKIRIVGNNNTIIFKSGVRVGKMCSFWMEGNNITIIIGDNTTFTHTVHFCAQEDNTSIIVGNDCMFANTIIVRTSDSHPIIDIESKQRINPAKNVTIGNHVWIAPHTKIMKGAKIGDNTIIGSNTMVSKEIPSNCLAVGAPAKIVKTGVTWTRDRLF